MMALLKWTSIAFAGVIASTFLFILAVIFAVQMAPAGMSPWHVVGLIAVTLYLWLFVLGAVVQVLGGLRFPDLGEPGLAPLKRRFLRQDA